jgi:RNA polymerase sigma-70 factor (ECF subfamily)
MDFEQHVAFVTTICRRYLDNNDDVADAVQDTFVQAATSFGRFRHRGEGSFRAWLAKIAMTVSVRILRKKGCLSNLDCADEPTSSEESPPDYMKVPPEELYNMIQSLVLNLHAFENKTHKEIGNMLGIDEGTSASQYHYAKLLLAKKITEYLRRMNHE